MKNTVAVGIVDGCLVQSTWGANQPCALEGEGNVHGTCMGSLVRVMHGRKDRVQGPVGRGKKRPCPRVGLIGRREGKAEEMTCMGWQGDDHAVWS